MKKLTALVLALVCVLSFVGCNGPKQLTLKKVIELSAKGEALTWSDFEQYESTDVGSGLRILQYDIDKDFYLLIGGGRTDEPPMYIHLAYQGSNENAVDYIDIRKDDVKEFIVLHQKLA